MHREDGFTLIELMAVMAIGAILLTLSGAAVRHFWLAQTLDGATDEVVAQLRQVQQRATTESNPLVYGIHFREGSSDWKIVRYTPGTSSTQTCLVTEEDGVKVKVCTAGTDGTADACELVESETFGTGVFSAAVEISAADFSAGGGTDEQAVCRGALGTSPKSKDKFVMFYARGSATAGSVTLRQPTLDRTEQVNVAGLTGRVTRS